MPLRTRLSHRPRWHVCWVPSAGYVHSAGFYVEILSCLPLDVIQAGSGWEPGVRALKFLRLYVVKVSLGRLQSGSESPSVINFIVLVRLVLIWLLLPNIFCVVRILLIRFGDDDDEWKNRERNLDPTINHPASHWPWAGSTAALGVLGCSLSCAFARHALPRPGLPPR